MIRMYSKRLLLPYVGIIQVAELGRARALSLDGENWSIRYALVENERPRDREERGDPRRNYPLIATIERARLEPRAVHPVLDPDEIRSVIRRLFEAVSAASVPFPGADNYEYWLLDSGDDRPLALLHSTVDAEEMRQPPARPTWIAMPAAQLEVAAPEPRQNHYVPPVNYRLERLIEERAGARPRAAWFQRTDPLTDDFPPCLIREDWDDEERQQLCDRYIARLAPRLLMLQGLPQPVRQRLEQAARNHVFDVERFHPLYPEVVDEGLMTAARVEATIRRAGEA